MQIIDEHVALLSDYEVWDHLNKQKHNREEFLANMKHPPRISANILTIEYEVLNYMNELKGAVPRLNEGKVLSLLNYLKELPITKAERLQILNLLPQNMVELYLILEECEERFSGEQLEDVLAKIGSAVGGE